MPCPFPCGPVIPECSWKKTQIEKKNDSDYFLLITLIYLYISSLISVFNVAKMFWVITFHYTLPRYHNRVIYKKRINGKIATFVKMTDPLITNFLQNGFPSFFLVVDKIKSNKYILFYIFKKDLWPCKTSTSLLITSVRRDSLFSSNSYHPCNIQWS